MLFFFSRLNVSSQHCVARWHQIKNITCITFFVTNTLISCAPASVHLKENRSEVIRKGRSAPLNDNSGPLSRRPSWRIELKGLLCLRDSSSTRRTPAETPRIRLRRPRRVFVLTKLKYYSPFTRTPASGETEICYLNLYSIFKQGPLIKRAALYWRENS